MNFHEESETVTFFRFDSLNQIPGKYRSTLDIDFTKLGALTDIICTNDRVRTHIEQSTIFDQQYVSIIFIDVLDVFRFRNQFAVLKPERIILDIMKE